MSISTLSFNTSTRTSLLRLSSQVAEATQELNSGRHLDVGVTLGRLTGGSVSARAQESSFKEQQTSNGLVSRRLKNIDASLATISESAQSIGNNLLASDISTNYDTIIDQARSGMQTLVGALNATGDGQFLFGGINTDVQPVTIDATTSAALASSFSDFVAAATGGKTAADLTPAQMTAYLSDDGFTTGGTTYSFSAQFDATWDSWSQASSESIESRISKNETISSSASANAEPFKQMAAAYTLLTTVGLNTLGDAVRNVVTQKAAVQLHNADGDVITMRASVGTKLARIDASNAELLRQQDLMNDTFSALENVDITEAGLRVNALNTQLQAAYSVTGKIQGLSILDYI